MAATIQGPWSKQQRDVFLSEAAYPLRLACVGTDGFPRIASLWYLYRSESLHCVTHRDSKIAGLLAADGRAGFEISTNDPPYYGIRGQGVVTLQPLGQNSTLKELLQHYLGGLDSDLALWLLSRSAEELLVTIDPQRLYTWDYRKRMAGIG